MPHGGLPTRLASHITSTSAEGVTVTASATAHTKGSWTELIASTSFAAQGIWVMLNNTGTSNIATPLLVDIGIGAASSETVLIPDLQGGQAQLWSNGFLGQCYFFPLRIPGGVRLSARCQATIVSDTVNVGVWLLGGSSVPTAWTGTRVTAYGVNAAASSGASYAVGATNAWGAASQIVASTTNPIRYIQVGLDAALDTSVSNSRSLLRLGTGATPTYFVENLPFGESTTIETLHTWPANWMLSQMHFCIPAATELRVSGMHSAAGDNRRIIVYGVD